MSVPLTRVSGVSTSDRSRTLRDAIGLGAAVGLYGVAFGAAAAGAGLSTWQALTMSALMFTGASQFALVGVLSAGGGAAAAVGSALLLGLRRCSHRAAGRAGRAPRTG
jgi:predicted branched-subunit amino acid permease